MLYLASQSPRRLELLRQLDVPFHALHAPVTERRAQDETAAGYVSRVAREKAEAGLTQVTDDDSPWVLGADTEVVLDGEVFGKPVDAADAAAMLRRLAGTAHEVISAVWLIGAQARFSAQCRSTVRFGTLADDQIAAYVATGEWQDKAGGYAIQSRAGALIEHLSGSYSAVMGLPLFETRTLLRDAGLMA